MKVVPADTDRFGTGHGFNTSPSDGTAAAIAAPPPRSATRAGCSRAWRSTRRPTRSTWSQRRVGRAGGGDPLVKTVEDVALYAHGTGALPPGVEGGLDAQTVYRD